MVDKNASMYLGSPRMAEMVIGEKVTLEEMGGARMHCTVSGCGDVLVKTEDEAIDFCRRYLSYLPSHCGEARRRPPPRRPTRNGTSRNHRTRTCPSTCTAFSPA
jgi:acetyl-CoA carboxylase carboxyltransferase component